MRNPYVIRHLTGDLLLLFGLALTITGSVGSASVRAKPAGISIDLWTGLAMPLVSLMMIAWASWRPPSALSRQRRTATATDAAAPLSSVAGTALAGLVWGTIVSRSPVAEAVIQPASGSTQVLVFIIEAASIIVLMAG